VASVRKRNAKANSSGRGAGGGGDLGFVSEEMFTWCMKKINKTYRTLKYLF
jgi:hypothetical protein